MQAFIGVVLPFGIMMAIFYFFLIKPQQKEKLRLDELVASLEKGDKVTTFSGIIGRVEKIDKEKNTVVINSEGSHFLLQKEAISGKINEN